MLAHDGSKHLLSSQAAARLKHPSHGMLLISGIVRSEKAGSMPSSHYEIATQCAQSTAGWSGRCPPFCVMAAPLTSPLDSAYLSLLLHNCTLKLHRHTVPCCKIV